MTTRDPARLAQFASAYRAGLAKAVETYPEDYADGVKTNVDLVADRMVAAIERGSYNYDGRGFKLACKFLGIKHTRTAIKAFLGGN